VATDLISGKVSSPCVSLESLDVNIAEQFSCGGGCDQRLEGMLELL
jgi:hypothetical protein